MALQHELGHKHPFASKEHEALLSVYFTANRIKRRATGFFRDHELTDVQFNVLSLLKHQSNDEGGLTQIELSRMLLVNRANITSILDRMEKAGLIRRTPAANDRRYNLVKLTPRGRHCLEAAEKDYMTAVHGVMSVLNNDELDSLIAMLNRVRDRLAKTRA